MPTRWIKLFLLLAHLATGLIACILFLAFTAARQQNGPLPSTIVCWWHKRLCRIFEINIVRHGAPHSGCALYVANHISWIDIPVLGRETAPCFVAKSELREWPLIGWLASKTGTIFLRRGNGASAFKMTTEIRRLILDRRNVAIFPEGTTTDGKQVGLFHSAPFAAVVDTDCWIQPICIRYPLPGGGHSPIAPFIEEMSLASHVWRLLGEHTVSVEVTFCPPVSCTGKNRQILSIESHTLICNTLQVNRRSHKLTNRD